MRRQGIFAIILAAVFAVSLVVYFAVIRPVTAPKETEKEIPETELGEVFDITERYFMFKNLTRGEIDNVTVNNEHGSFTFENVGEAGYCIRGYDNVTFDEELFATLLNISSYTLAKTKVGSNLSDEKIAEYGLDEPRASWTVTAKDGSSYTVLVGDKLLTGGGYYCQLEGRKSAYVLDVAIEKTVLVPIEEYVQPVLVAGISKDDYYLTEDFTMYKNGEKLFSLRLLDKDEMVNKNALAEVMMDYPTEYYPNSSIYFNLVYSFIQLNADGCAKLGVTYEDLEEYGLLEPAHKMTFKYADAPFEVSFSELQEDGFYYAHSNFMPTVIAKCSAENFEFLEYDLLDWVDEYMFQQYITNISNMTVKSDKVDVNYDLSHSYSEDGKELLYVKANGESLNEDGIAHFRQYYKSFLALALKDYYVNDEYCSLTEEEMEALIADKNNAYLEFTYTTLNGEETTLAFYRYSTRHSLVTVNGVGEFYVLTDLVQKIENDTVRILNGEEVIAFDKN